MIIKDGYRYEVADKAVRAWFESQGLDEPPFLFQDVRDGSGIPFSSDSEATEWMEQYIIATPVAPITQEEIPAEEPVVG